MKKVLLITLYLFYSLSLYAQNNSGHKFKVYSQINESQIVINFSLDEIVDNGCMYNVRALQVSQPLDDENGIISINIFNSEMGCAASSSHYGSLIFNRGDSLPSLRLGFYDFYINDVFIKTLILKTRVGCETGNGGPIPNH